MDRAVPVDFAEGPEFQASSFVRQASISDYRATAVRRLLPPVDRLMAPQAVRVVDDLKHPVQLSVALNTPSIRTLQFGSSLSVAASVFHGDFGHQKR
jgi:hypothetical protein